MSVRTDTDTGGASSSREASRPTRSFAPLAAAALGLLLIYGSGFAQIDAVHNAAHDARHAAGFPCH